MHASLAALPTNDATRLVSGTRKTLALRLTTFDAAHARLESRVIEVRDRVDDREDAR
jgi:hypothetical protein